MIRRSSRMSNTIPGISRFPCGVLLAQHRIEAVFLDEIRKHPGVTIDRNIEPISIEIDRPQVQDHSSHVISVELKKAVQDNNVPDSNGVDQAQKRKRKRAGSEQGESCQEIVRAKYVIGCDGAHSWTRAQLGLNRLPGYSISLRNSQRRVWDYHDHPTRRRACEDQS